MKLLSEFINKIIQGNSLDILKEIHDNSVQLVLTDPPYNISSDIKITMSNHMNGNSNERELTYDFGIWDHFDSEKSYMEFTEKWMKECYRILNPSGNFVTFSANWLTGDIKRMWEKQGGRARQKLYWKKSNPKPRLRKVDFQQSIEEMFWGAKSDNGHIFNYQLGQQMNCIESAVFYNNERTGHPTQKPEIVVGWIIDYLSNTNDIILDPFCGSGTIPFVAQKHNRKFIGVEQKKEYVEISRNRVTKNIVTKQSIIKNIEVIASWVKG